MTAVRKLDTPTNGDGWDIFGWGMSQLESSIQSVVNRAAKLVDEFSIPLSDAIDTAIGEHEVDGLDDAESYAALRDAVVAKTSRTLQ